MSRKSDRFGESRRRGGAWWRDRFFLWILLLTAAGLIVMTPQGRSLLALAVIHLTAVAIHEGGHYLAALRLRKWRSMKGAITWRRCGCGIG